MWKSCGGCGNLHDMINVVKDRIVIDGKPYPLSAYRAWLSANHTELVKNHFIKTIIKDGKSFRTYDWSGIYSTATQYNLHLNFKDEYQRDRSGS